MQHERFLAPELLFRPDFVSADYTTPLPQVLHPLPLQLHSSEHRQVQTWSGALSQARCLVSADSIRRCPVLVVRRAWPSVASHASAPAKDADATLRSGEHSVLKTVFTCSWWTAQSRAAPLTPDEASMATLSSA